MGFARTIALVCILMAVVLTPALAAGYYNVSNVPYNTVSNGPQNAVIVDVTNPNDPASVNAAVNTALSRVPSRAAYGSLSRQIAVLRQAGLLHEGQEYFLDGLVLVRSKGTFEPVSRATRAYGGGSITFQYTGWDLDTETKLKAFVAIAYPIIKQIYGDPAKTITVKIVADSGTNITDRQLGAIYVTGSGVQPEIRLYSTPRDGMLGLERMLLPTLIRTFHDTASFNYDAWEEGFRRAASVVAGELIDRQISQSPGNGLEQMDIMGKEVNGDAFSYLMSCYEALNQPSLSNNTFARWGTDPLAPGDVWGGMLVSRHGMASTAWLKIYTERLKTDGQSFFKLFNQAYYSQLSANSGLPGNVPALKGIAAGVTPNVEGLSFDDWFRRQYIFDTSVTIGKKLHVFTFTPASRDDQGGYSRTTFLIYYQTAANGSETPLEGTVYPVYWDYQYKNDIYVSDQYGKVDIAGGEGYLVPTFYPDNIGGAQRVAMDFTIGSETRRVYFPIGTSGTDASPSTVAGAVIGANSGSIGIKVNNGGVISTSVTNGAYGAIADILDFSKLTITYTPTSGSPVTRTVNVGPGAYEALLYAQPSVKSLDHTFAAGIRMFSVPMTPLAQDAAQALQGPTGSPAVASDKLMIARWNPLLTGTDKYERYPTIGPLATGKAYWTKLSSSVIVTVKGEVPDPTSSYRIGLEPGWNQIGGPFETAVDINNIMVERANDEPVSFSQAWSMGLIGKIVWKYVPGSDYDEATMLDPWEGYWIKCNVPTGVVLVVPGPGARSRAAKVTAEPVGSGSEKDKSWSIKLSAVTPEGNSSKVTLGLATGATDGFDNAFDSEVPPSYAGATTIAANLPGRAGEQCAIDTRSAGASKISWGMTVTPAGPNQDVIIKWQDIAQAPKAYKLTLVDESTGRAVFMRTNSSYRFNSGDGSPKRLTVVADSSPTARLMLTGLIMGPTRGSGLTFSYNLTSAAEISAEIVGSSGRHVRSLNSGRATRSGINSLSWDKCDDAGRPVPSGIYILQLNAVSEEGEVVKGIRPVLVAR